MPRDRSRIGPPRSARFGPGRRAVFNPQQGRVMRLNQGSSPHGRSSTLGLNQPGGTFGSGRMAGGALAALLGGSPGRNPGGVTGSPEIGPPPMPPSPLPGAFRPPAAGVSFPRQGMPPTPSPTLPAGIAGQNLATYPTSPWVSDPTQLAMPSDTFQKWWKWPTGGGGFRSM